MNPHCQTSHFGKWLVLKFALARKKMSSKITKFFGYQTPLSNLHFSEFRRGGKYHSVEQFVCAEKARHFEDVEAEKKSMESKSGCECHHIKINTSGKPIGSWLEVVDNVLWLGMLHKFINNARFRKYLMKMEGNRLAY